jgi:hypothetical protein
MIPVEAIPGIGGTGAGDERELLRRWIHVWYFWYILRTYVDATMFSHPAQQWWKKKRLGHGIVWPQRELWDPSLFLLLSFTFWPWGEQFCSMVHSLPCVATPQSPNKRGQWIMDWSLQGCESKWTFPLHKLIFPGVCFSNGKLTQLSSTARIPLFTQRIFSNHFSQVNPGYSW